MRIAIIGRSQLLYRTARELLGQGYEIALVVTAKEAPEYSVTAADFEALARETGAAYIYTPRISVQEYADRIRAQGPIDIAVSINYTGVIPQEVIDLFPLGILNAHAGDLPRYRGNAPLAWSIINGETRVGLCVHRMVGGELDSGDILAKDYRPIDHNTRVGELFEWIEQRVAPLMLQALDRLRENPDFRGETQSKDPRHASRCYPRKPEDGRLDWSRSSLEVLRLINASSEPLPGAFGDLDGERIVIWRATPHEDDEQYSAVPGQVAHVDPDGPVVVITGRGKLRITDVSYRNERSAPAKFVRSIRKRLK